jgi:hypothetical protein
MSVINEEFTSLLGSFCPLSLYPNEDRWEVFQPFSNKIKIKA